MAIDKYAENVPIGHTPVYENNYSRFDYWLAYKEYEYMKWQPIVRQLLGKFRWKENEGAAKLRREIESPSPIKSQIPNPNKLLDGSPPSVDIINTNRFWVETEPVQKRFHSPRFQFRHSFIEKVPSNIKRIRENIQKRVISYDEQYLLGELYHHAPRFYVAGYGYVDAPSGPTSNSAKTSDWVVQQLIANAMEPSIMDLGKIAIDMHDNQDIPYFMGKDFDPKNPIAGGTFAMLGCSEFMLNLGLDPFLLGNKDHNIDVVGDCWKRTPFGFYTWRTWRKPFRFKQDGTMANLQIKEDAADAPNKGETVPDPQYTLLVNSPYECVPIIGKGVGDALELGPPPSEFRNGEVSEDILKMDWNGKVKSNALLLTPSVDEDGNNTMLINPGGRERQLEADWVGGFAPVQRRAITWYFFKRRLGPVASA